MSKENSELTFTDKLALKTQRMLGWITFPSWGTFYYFVIRFVGRYRLMELRTIRKRYQQMVKRANRPVAICANHLTKMDSALITRSLASIWSYMRSFRLFSSNLPERARYANNLFLRLNCYLGSCIPVDRGGNRYSVKKSLNKLIYLLRQGETAAIFPEGKRSRDGIVDESDFSYGVGRLISSVKNCNILCIYMRGRGQKTYSSVPRWGEELYFEMKTIKPKSVYQGLRATRDLAKQVITQLKHMEQHYFALCGK